MAKKATNPERRIGITRSAAVGEELARYYETGLQIKDAIGLGRKFGRKARVEGQTREALMLEHGLSRDLFYKTLDFACLYTRQEFEALRRRRNPDTDEPLRWTHVRTLLGFSREDLKTRTALEIEAVKSGWSARRLLEEAQKARGGPQKERGGPRFKYKDLFRWARETERYLEGLFEEDDPDSDSGRLVIERVLATTRENRKGLMDLARVAANVGELAGDVASRAARQRRSIRKSTTTKRRSTKKRVSD